MFRRDFFSKSVLAMFAGLFASKGTASPRDVVLTEQLCKDYLKSTGKYYILDKPDWEEVKKWDGKCNYFAYPTAKIMHSEYFGSLV